MQDRNTVLLPVIVAVSVLLLSACATNKPATDQAAEEAAAKTQEAASAPPAEESQQQKEKVFEVIPLDPSAAEASMGTETGSAADSGQQGADTEQAAAPPEEVVPRPDIAGTVKKMLDHRNTIWHSRDSTYRLYVGRQFLSQYSPGDKTLTIKSDKPGSGLECTYAMDGKLDSPQDGQKKACLDLARAVDNYVTNQ
jgi:hypothetical protein